MKANFKLITILGIPVEINVTWLIIFGLVVLSLGQGYYPTIAPELSPAIHWTMGVISALLLFICLLLHELSHSVIAKRNRLPIAGITLFVFGGVAHMKKEPASPKTEFKMAIAGPIMSIALAFSFLLLLIIFNLLQINPMITAVFNYLFMINLAVAVFNLIPAFPLDGGRILRASLWYYKKDLKSATRIAVNFGKSFAVILMVFGVVNFMSGNIISGVWFIFLGIFLSEAAELSYRQMLMKKIFSRFRAEDLMREEITNQASPPAQENLFIKPDGKLEEALEQMSASNTDQLYVMEDGKLIGILYQKDILKLFKFRLDTER